MFISGSSTSTGSFGRVETAGNINLKSTDNALTFTTGSKELSLSLYQALHPNGNQGTNSSALMLGGQKVFEPRSLNNSYFYSYNSLNFRQHDDPTATKGNVSFQFGDAADSPNPETRVNVQWASFRSTTNRQAEVNGYFGVIFTKQGAQDDAAPYIKFGSGNTNLDSYFYSGSIFVTGEGSSGDIVVQGTNAKISGSSTSTGSFGRGVIADTLRINKVNASATPLMIGAPSSNMAVFHISNHLGNESFRVDVSSDGDAALTMRDSGQNADIYLHTATHTYFNHNGNFGIGTTSPGAKLTVHGDISGSATSTGSFGHGYIDSRLGIGTTSPAVDLDVVAQDAKIKIMSERHNTATGTTAHFTTLGYDSSGARPFIISNQSNTPIFFKNNAGSIPLAIHTNQFIGINNTSPTKQLHIKNTSGDNRGLMVENTVASSYAELQVKASKEFRIGTGGSSTSVANQFYVYDATSGAHRFDIDTNGNIGIGTTDPSHKLDVQNNGQTIIQAKATNTGRAKLHLDAYNNISEIYFKLTGADKGAIYQESDGTKLNVYSFAGASYGYEVMTWKYSDGRVGIKQHDPEYDLDVTGTGRFTDDLRVEGDIIAENYIVSSSVTYMTQSFSSGSTIFGDTGDDTHQFTGSLKIQSGSIDITSTQSPNYAILGKSSEGTQYFKIRNSNSEAFPTGQIILNYSTSNYSMISAGSNQIRYIGGTNTSVGSHTFLGGNNSTEIAKFHATNGLTVSLGNIVSKLGNISGSSTSTGSFGRVELAGASSTNSTISVQDGVNNGILRLQGSTRVSSPGSYIQLYGPNGSYGSAVFNYGYNTTNSELSFTVDGSEKVRFGGQGQITATSIETTGISNVGGNISGSSTSTGSFGSLVVADAIQGDTTLKGGFLYFDAFKGPRTNSEYLDITSTRGFRFNDHGAGVKFQVDGTHNIIYLGTNSLNMTTRVYGDLRLDYGDFDITGSSSSTGSFGRVEAAGVISADDIGRANTNIQGRAGLFGTSDGNDNPPTYSTSYQGIFEKYGGTAQVLIKRTGYSQLFLQSRHDYATVGTLNNYPLRFITNSTEAARFDTSQNFLPGADNTQDLGSSTKRWANIHSADLHLSNEDTEGNEVDGTTGNWTIQEGEDDLYLLNRKNGKKYRFKLEEIT